jgi:hypothetical protein
LRWPTGRGAHTGGVLAILAVEAALGLAPGRAARVAAARELRETFDRALRPPALDGPLGPGPPALDGPVQGAGLGSPALDGPLGPGLLIHPVYPCTAPRHRAIAARSPLDVGCTALFNVTESPVTVVRAGTDHRGLPIGVQIVGARGADALTLAAAEVVEQMLGVPAPVDPRAPAR